MSEYQAIREAQSARPAHSSSLQSEGVGLLSTSQLRRPEQNQRAQSSSLEVTPIFSTSGPLSDTASGACTTQNPRCDTDSKWRPDYQRRTQGARDWDREAQGQRAKPLETNPNDSYRVQRGDCLDDIARRMLRQESSQNPSRREVSDATRRILEANPELRCNPNLIRPGMELKIPRRTDGPPPREMETTREGTSREGTRRDGTNREGTQREETSREPKVPKKEHNSDITNKEKTEKIDKDPKLEEMKKCLESMRRHLEELQRTTKKPY